MEDNDEVKKAAASRRLLYVVVILLLGVLVWFGWRVKETLFKEKPVHLHAGFMVVKNNKQEDFSDPKYMLISPCTTETGEDHEETKEHMRLEKAHLHDEVGDVVHVENGGAIWKDLFINIGYELNYTDVEAYINGNKVANFQNLPIKANDSLVVFIGKDNDMGKFLAQRVTEKHIQEVGKKSEDCGTH